MDINALLALIGQQHSGNMVAGGPGMSEKGTSIAQPAAIGAFGSSAEQLAGGGPSLDEAGRNGLSRFLGHNGMMDASVVPENGEGIGQWGSQSELDAAMAALKQFDPNAKIEQGVISYDQSKLPQFQGGDLGGHDLFNAGLTSLNTNDAGSRMLNPNAVIHDKNYGDYTPTRNLSAAANDTPSGAMGQLEKYMPGVISSVMAMATGGALSPQLVQMVAGLANGSGDWEGLLAKLGGMLANTYVPGAGTAINLAAGQMNRGR
jgi:hypothetical protein